MIIVMSVILMDIMCLEKNNIVVEVADLNVGASEVFGRTIR